jgi:hypothetical protein
MQVLENRLETESWIDCDEQPSPTPRQAVLEWYGSHTNLHKEQRKNPQTDYKPSNPLGYLDFIRNADYVKPASLPECDLTSLWVEMQKKWDLCELKTLHTNFPTVSFTPSQFALDFNVRAERWRRDTSLQSSLVAQFMHDDYQTIMAMGERVIPLILGRLQKAPEGWFWALKHLAGEDIAKDADNPADAVKAWLKWGKKKDYIE